jgi:hypothetical protein
MFRKTAGAARLTDVERRLVDHVTRGELLDLAGDGPVDEAAMRAWDSARTVRAAVLRDILRGRLAPDPDLHGLRLRGARIAGRIDLANLTTSLIAALYDCLLEEGLVARDATLPRLILSGCWLKHRDESPLAVDRLTAAVLVLDRAVVTAHCKTGAVELIAAHLGQLNCTDATLRNDTGPALVADRLQVDQSVFLRGGFEGSAPAKLARSGCRARTSAGWSVTVPGCATTAAPPCTPTTSRSTRVPSSWAGSRRSAPANVVRSG